MHRILRCWAVVAMVISLAATGALADLAMERHGDASATAAHGALPCGGHDDDSGHGADVACVAMIGPCIAGVERAVLPMPFTPSALSLGLAPGRAEARPGCLPDEELPPPRA